jgi:hypothetical protein
MAAPPHFESRLEPQTADSHCSFQLELFKQIVLIMEPQPVSAPPGFGARGSSNPPPGFGNNNANKIWGGKNDSAVDSEASQRGNSAPGGHSEDRRGRGRGGAGRGGRNNQPQSNTPKKEQDTSRGGKPGRGGSRGGGNNRRGQTAKPKLQNIGDSYSTGSPAAPVDDELSSATESIENDDDLSLSPSSPAEDALPDDWPVCLTCCDPIRWFSVGACNHCEVCAMCCIRMRKLYDDKDCCICKVRNHWDQNAKRRDLSPKFLHSPSIYFSSKRSFFTFSSRLVSFEVKISCIFCNASSRGLVFVETFGSCDCHERER